MTNITYFCCCIHELTKNSIKTCFKEKGLKKKFGLNIESSLTIDKIWNIPNFGYKFAHIYNLFPAHFCAAIIPDYYLCCTFARLKVIIEKSRGGRFLTGIEIWAGFGPVWQLLRPVFPCFDGKKKVLKTL